MQRLPFDEVRGCVDTILSDGFASLSTERLKAVVHTVHGLFEQSRRSRAAVPQSHRELALALQQVLHDTKQEIARRDTQKENGPRA